MAEDTCRNGHPRTPENTSIRPCDGHIVCRDCRRAARFRRRQANLDRAREQQRATQARYAATPKGWETARRSRLKGERAAVIRKLDELAAEEAELWAAR